MVYAIAKELDSKTTDTLSLLHDKSSEAIFVALLVDT